MPLYPSPVRLKNKLKNYQSNTKGNMAIMVAIGLTPLLAIIGLALDMMIVYNIKSEAQLRLDTAVLASVLEGGDKNASVAKIEKLGENKFTESFAPLMDDATLQNVNINYDENTGEAVGFADIEVKTILMSVIGKDLVSINVQSTAISQNEITNPTDISIMLDVSGSMKGAKLNGLKDAVTGFLDGVIGASNESETTRVSFAPFSTSINAGSYATSLTGTPAIENCVAERSGSKAFKDASPNSEMFSVNGTYTITKDDNNGVYREASYDGYPTTPGRDQVDVSTVCPDAEIFPLTGDYQSLLEKLDTYEAAGLTAGHLGIAYTWYLISEEWRDFWPSSSRPGFKTDTNKVAILMTDGEFNTYYQSSNGEPNHQGKKLCDKMKSDEITIFSVSFDTDGDSEDLLKDCASDTEYYFDTDTNSELYEAFAEIAELINERGARLTQ